MLLWLAEYLQQFNTGFSVVNYLSVRAIFATLTALIIALWFGPYVIRTLQKNQIGQSVRDDGPKSHLSKSGTPTMGGVMILMAIGISTLLWGNLGNHYVWVVLLVTLATGAVVGISLILILGRDKNIPIPFGPYLAAAGFIAAIWGNELTQAYFEFMGIR